ncbi:MAG: insulinase family protein [Acidobacteria bacterium]|nr:insulinase family protein [Acidobacteriota bacterium]MBU4331061.1 insulinase family protein [Acidobacteriota bacterium]MCG2815543.1 insulinase family protein [Candidatus Aminicenantes bacterium]
MIDSRPVFSRIGRRAAAFVLLFLLSVFLPAQERFRRQPPNPDPRHRLNLPRFLSHTLKNNLTIHVVPLEYDRRVTLKLIIYSGESSSPENLPGLATFTANLLDKGTLTLSVNAVEEAIAAIGGEWSAAVQPERTIFTLSFLDEYLDRGVEILSRFLLEPAFSQREIVNLQRTLYYQMFNRRKDSEFIGKNLFHLLLFNGHPYSRISFNEDIFKYIKQKDIQQFFEKNYRTNNASLILVGNIDLETASRHISTHLNTWNPAADLPADDPLPRPLRRLRIGLVDDPQADGAYIFLGNIIPLQSSLDIFHYAVFNMVLGGTLNSRLFMNLRESKQYAYNAFSEVNFFKNFGIFLVTAKVKPAVLNQSIKEILRELDTATKRKLPSNEIEQAKSYLIGQFPVRMEIQEEYTGRVTDVISLNLGDSHWAQYFESITSVNADNVFEQLKDSDLLSPVIVIVVNADLESRDNPLLDPKDNPLINRLMAEFGEIEVYNEKGILQYTLK